MKWRVRASELRRASSDTNAAGAAPGIGTARAEDETQGSLPKAGNVLWQGVGAGGGEAIEPDVIGSTRTVDSGIRSHVDGRTIAAGSDSVKSFRVRSWTATPSALNEG